MTMSDDQIGGNDVSAQQLAAGLWYLKHRDQLRHALVGMLIGICVLTWGYTIYGGLRHGFLEWLSFEQHWMELTTPQNPRYGLVRRAWAKPIQVGEVITLPEGDGRYTVAVRVVNPNPRILATVRYLFNVPGSTVALPETTTVLLPGRERWLIASGTGAPSGTGRVAIYTTWDRIGHKEARDVARYIDERLAVTVADATFRTGSDLQLGTDGATLGRAAVTITNASAYGLRDLELATLLRRGSAIIGARRTIVPLLQAGETAVVDATWYHAFGLVQSVEAHAYANVFDPATFVDAR